MHQASQQGPNEGKSIKENAPSRQRRDSRGKEDDKGGNRSLNSWSLTRAKPEPSIENYIVQIDGRLKKDPKAPVLAAAAPVGTTQQNKVQPKRKLT